MAKRKRYTDDFRATAVTMLDALGYDGNGDKTGALTKVSNEYNVPLSTLRGWWTAEHNPAPAEVRSIKNDEIIGLIRKEIYGALTEMPNARPEANYKDLATAGAILIDKLQLLQGKATERIEHSGHVTHEERTKRITELLDTARNRRDRQSSIH